MLNDIAARCKLKTLTLLTLLILKSFQKNQLQRHICSLQISRLCGAHSSLSAEHLQALYSALSLHYEHSFSAFDKNLLPTDIGISDQYALLAGELGRIDRSSSPLVLQFY